MPWGLKSGRLVVLAAVSALLLQASSTSAFTPLQQQTTTSASTIDVSGSVGSSSENSSSRHKLAYSSSRQHDDVTTTRKPAKASASTPPKRYIYQHSDDEDDFLLQDNYHLLQKLRRSHDSGGTSIVRMAQRLAVPGSLIEEHQHPKSAPQPDPFTTTSDLLPDDGAIRREGAPFEFHDERKEARRVQAVMPPYNELMEVEPRGLEESKMGEVEASTESVVLEPPMTHDSKSAFEKKEENTASAIEETALETEDVEPFLEPAQADSMLSFEAGSEVPLLRAKEEESSALEDLSADDGLIEKDGLSLKVDEILEKLDLVDDTESDVNVDDAKAESGSKQEVVASMVTAQKRLETDDIDLVAGTSLLSDDSSFPSLKPTPPKEKVPTTLLESNYEPQQTSKEKAENGFGVDTSTSGNDVELPFFLGDSSSESDAQEESLAPPYSTTMDPFEHVTLPELSSMVPVLESVAETVQPLLTTLSTGLTATIGFLKDEVAPQLAEWNKDEASSADDSAVVDTDGTTIRGAVLGAMLFSLGQHGGIVDTTAAGLVAAYLAVAPGKVGNAVRVAGDMAWQGQSVMVPWTREILEQTWNNLDSLAASAAKATTSQLTAQPQSTKASTKDISLNENERTISNVVGAQALPEDRKEDSDCEKSEQFVDKDSLEGGRQAEANQRALLANQLSQKRAATAATATAYVMMTSDSKIRKERVGATRQQEGQPTSKRSATRARPCHMEVFQRALLAAAIAQNKAKQSIDTTLNAHSEAATSQSPSPAAPLDIAVARQRRLSEERLGQESKVKAAQQAILRETFQRELLAKQFQNARSSLAKSDAATRTTSSDVASMPSDKLVRTSRKMKTAQRREDESFQRTLLSAQLGQRMKNQTYNKTGPLEREVATHVAADKLADQERFQRALLACQLSFLSQQRDKSTVDDKVILNEDDQPKQQKDVGQTFLSVKKEQAALKAKRDEEAEEIRAILNKPVLQKLEARRAAEANKAENERRTEARKIEWSKLLANARAEKARKLKNEKRAEKRAQSVVSDSAYEERRYKLARQTVQKLLDKNKAGTKTGDASVSPRALEESRRRYEEKVQRKLLEARLGQEKRQVEQETTAPVASNNVGGEEFLLNSDNESVQNPPVEKKLTGLELDEAEKSMAEVSARLSKTRDSTDSSWLEGELRAVEEKLESSRSGSNPDVAEGARMGLEAKIDATTRLRILSEETEKTERQTSFHRTTPEEEAYFQKLQAQIIRNQIEKVKKQMALKKSMEAMSAESGKRPPIQDPKLLHSLHILAKIVMRRPSLKHAIDKKEEGKC